MAGMPLEETTPVDIIRQVIYIAYGKFVGNHRATLKCSGGLMRNLMLPVFMGLLAVHVFASAPAQQMKIEQVMTPKELQDTGIATLTAPQRQALNDWLNRYSLKLLLAASQQERTTPESRPVRSSCAPAIETTISGEIEGWDGETIFKLDNGQIWQQAEYDYTYFYAYRPDVTIYQTSAGCRMKVEDETETVLVKRIK